MRINSKYKYSTTPLAKKEAMIVGEKYRFTILTPRLFRVEYNQNGEFEDRATQVVINRVFDVPEFTVEDEDGILKIVTEAIQITYTKKPLSKNSLTVCYVGDNAGIRAGRHSSEWSFAEENRFNMKGTARTLDNVDGECELENGIISRGEVTFIDDSKSLIIADDGVIETREHDCQDYYIFCYGTAGDKRFDCYGCLNDFYKLTGKTPLLPRFALGNWWSRYYAYTQDEYIELMKRFKRENVPFSVAVIDMDWHYVDIDTKYGTGWTGYSWNKELFPDHREFLKFLKEEGLKVSLNLHPQEGIAAHEDAYAQMAKAMGIDPETEKKVEFDITNPQFIENYFLKLHHPLEKEGVDFWWMDWQQGNTTRVPGLDPLWMLNHYHTVDHQRSDRRGLLFSRYSGPGSHRYPIGFSGDTVITWESLAFQPYFTSTASNIGYGWWSHDIGGHMEGYRDEELITRWIQFGTFSPINRLHSSKNPFLGKEPWKYNKISELSMKKFLKLRHEMIPYLYSMNYRAYKYNEPLVQPLYYKWGGEEAYKYKNEYSFGTEMIVSPITSPHDKDTTLGSVDTYFPDGVWYDFFSNASYIGGRCLHIYRDLYDMPVFVKSGGIVPMAVLENVNDVDNPIELRIRVYAGDNGYFEMYEDDGETMAHENGHYAITKIALDWSDKPVFCIHKPEGDISVIPEKRIYNIEFVGLESCNNITVTLNSKKCDYDSSYNNGVLSIRVENVTGELKVKFNENIKTKKNDTDSMLMKLLERAEISNSVKCNLYEKIISEQTIASKIAALSSFEVGKDISRAVLEILLSDRP